MNGKQLDGKCWNISCLYKYLSRQCSVAREGIASMSSLQVVWTVAGRPVAVDWAVPKVKFQQTDDETAPGTQDSASDAEEAGDSGEENKSDGSEDDDAEDGSEESEEEEEEESTPPKKKVKARQNGANSDSDAADEEDEDMEDSEDGDNDSTLIEDKKTPGTLVTCIS